MPHADADAQEFGGMSTPFAGMAWPGMHAMEPPAEPDLVGCESMPITQMTQESTESQVNDAEWAEWEAENAGEEAALALE